MKTLGSATGARFKPLKTVVPFAEAMAWRGGGGFHYTRKYDGVFKTFEIAPGTMIAAEHVRPKSGGAFTSADRELFSRWGEATDEPGAVRGDAHPTSRAGFSVALGLLSLDGQDVSRRPRRETWPELVKLISAGAPASRHGALGSGRAVPEAGAPPNLILPDEGHGGEFLEAVIAAGGEGVVAAPWDAPWGMIYAAKRVETFQAVITELGGGTQSVAIAIAGRPAGRVPLFGRKYDAVRIGSVLKVEGFGLTDDGKLREPRLCQDTPTSWLVRF